MKAFVIYDSQYGNTEKIAAAIFEALGAHVEAELVRAVDASPSALAQARLLIVGSPTQGFRPTEPVSRLLKGVSLKGVRAAAFDTRFKEENVDSGALRFMMHTAGYAAKRIASQLEKVGATLVAEPEGFYVSDTEGPLLDGELERAAAWALGLLEATPA